MGKPLSKIVSEEQEQYIARLLHGKVQPASGGTKFGGGDVHTKSFLIEAKTPTNDKKSFSIKQDWIEKAREQAFEQGKTHWALAFQFQPDGANYFVINAQLMECLVRNYERCIHDIEELERHL